VEGSVVTYVVYNHSVFLKSLRKNMKNLSQVPDRVSKRRPPEYEGEMFNAAPRYMVVLKMIKLFRNVTVSSFMEHFFV
jgi:hypothetical protein